MTTNLNPIPASLTPIAYVEGRYIWNLFTVPVRVTRKRNRLPVATVANLGV